MVIDHLPQLGVTPEDQSLPIHGTKAARDEGQLDLMEWIFVLL